jgi:hypothetical protein|tara:strand:- start:173 stop:619 length:447 start_codon:yes stop_codon:yes gene_type:complete
MSTRACYTFLDTFSRGETRSFHVYKHHDGYPYAQWGLTGEEAGGLVWIREALFYAWDLPRFEADEFAASFIVANKGSSGGIRLINTEHPWQFSGDPEYWYVVDKRENVPDLYVEVFEVDWWDAEPNNTLIMEGELHHLIEKQRKRKAA